MPALFVFLLKVNIALIVFCLGYYLVLRKLTFYTLNRVYLGVAIIFSSVYPIIDLNDFMLRHQQIAVPVQQVVINWQAPRQFIQQPGYWQWATILLWIGVVFFAARLLVQLFSLYKLYRNSTPVTIQQHSVRITGADISPFSFWRNIYINPDNLDPADLESILQHEQVHVKEWHTLDILLAEISLIFYWFNPGVWLMKKAVRENIEFITDRKILQNGIDSKAYQYSLLNVSIGTNTSAGIINHFNFSTLRKRINMMNAKKSSNLNLTRYAFLVPTVVICLCIFNISKAELVNKSKVAYRTIAASVNKIANNNNTEVAHNIALDTVRIHARKQTATNKAGYVTIKGVDIPVGVAYAYFPKDADRGTDTIIKAITVRKGSGADSVIHTVNGAVVSKEEYNKTASKTQSINFVTDYKYVPGNVKRVRINGQERTVNTTAAETLVEDIRLQDPSKVKKVIVDGVEAKVTSTQPLTFTYSTKDGDSVKNHTATMNMTYSFSTDPSAGKTTGKGYVIRSRPTLSVTDEDNSKTTIISDRISIIDGKEATEKDLKKLPASNIEKITIKEGQGMVDKYGEKAKNGVIIYTTKKAK
jgi:bla regulator protein BlaR1